MSEQWQDFTLGKWTQEINVRDFIQKNYTVYTGNESFLVSATSNTETLWDKVKFLMQVEREKGVLDTDTKVASTITSHAPGYIAQDREQIVGLQTDQPLKRAIMPLGGIRVVKNSLEAYTGTNWTVQQKRFLPSIGKLTTTVFSMYTPAKCGKHGTPALSQAYPMLTVAVGLSVTIGE